MVRQCFRCRLNFIKIIVFCGGVLTCWVLTSCYSCNLYVLVVRVVSGAFRVPLLPHVASSSNGMVYFSVSSCHIMGAYNSSARGNDIGGVFLTWVMCVARFLDATPVGAVGGVAEIAIGADTIGVRN